MFGASLPVAALSYDTIGELVCPGRNGELFEDAEGLEGHLERLLRGFGAHHQGHQGTQLLAHLRQGAAAWAEVRWEDAWAQHAMPLFQGDS